MTWLTSLRLPNKAFGFGVLALILPLRFHVGDNKRASFQSRSIEGRFHSIERWSSICLYKVNCACTLQYHELHSHGASIRCFFVFAFSLLRRPWKTVSICSICILRGEDNIDFLFLARVEEDKTDSVASVRIRT